MLRGWEYDCLQIEFTNTKKYQVSVSLCAPCYAVTCDCTGTTQHFYVECNRIDNCSYARSDTAWGRWEHLTYVMPIDLAVWTQTRVYECRWLQTNGRTTRTSTRRHFTCNKSEYYRRARFYWWQGIDNNGDYSTNITRYEHIVYVAKSQEEDRALRGDTRKASKLSPNNIKSADLQWKSLLVEWRREE